MSRLPPEISADYTPDWKPFAVLPREKRAPAPRAIDTFEGIADRMRTAAFAELQAIYAFDWGARRFEKEAPPGLCDAWRSLIPDEERHFQWLFERMKELKIKVDELPVSDWLWVSLTRCQSAKEFAVFMASSEERGRKAGVRFYEALLTQDPVTAQIFGKIAEEEIRHIQIAEQFYPEETVQKIKAR